MSVVNTSRRRPGDIRLGLSYKKHIGGRRYIDGYCGRRKRQVFILFFLGGFFGRILYLEFLLTRRLKGHCSAFTTLRIGFTGLG